MSLNDISKSADIAKNNLHTSKKAGAWITLTDNEIKDIIKVIKSLEI